MKHFHRLVSAIAFACLPVAEAAGQDRRSVSMWAAIGGELRQELRGSQVGIEPRIAHRGMHYSKRVEPSRRPHNSGTLGQLQREFAAREVPAARTQRVAGVWRAGNCGRHGVGSGLCRKSHAQRATPDYGLGRNLCPRSFGRHLAGRSAAPRANRIDLC